MALEFPCPKCQHLLRTADDKAGLSATCPACGESIWVPYPHQLSGQRSSDFEDPPSGDAYELGDDDSFAPESQSAARSANDDPFADESTPPGGSEAETYSLAEPDESPGDQRHVVICDHCGTENEPDAGQCTACGAELQPPTPPPRQGWEPRSPDVGEIMQSAWKIFSEELGLLIGAFLLLGLIGMGAYVVCLIPVGIGAAVAAAVDDDLIPFGIMAGAVLSIPMLFAAIGVLNVGYVRLNLNVAGGVPAGISDLFFGFAEGRSLILPMSVIYLLTAVVGSCTCGVGYLLVWPLTFTVVHRNAGIGDALTMGLEIIQKEFVPTLLIGLICAGAYVVMYLLNFCFYVGTVLMIFVLPFLITLMSVGYLRMERERVAVDRD